MFYAFFMHFATIDLSCALNFKASPNLPPPIFSLIDCKSMLQQKAEI